MKKTNQTSLAQLINKENNDLIRYSIRLPSELWLQAQKKSLDLGYGGRGVNRWINESIEKLYQVDKAIRNQIILDISLSEVTLGKSNHYGIRINQSIKEKIWIMMMESSWKGIELNPPVYLEPSYASVIKAAMLNELD